MKRVSLLVPLFAVTMIATAGADEVTAWNAELWRLNLVVGNTPQPSTRVGAIVAASVFDAVNGIEGRYEPFRVAPAAPPGTSARAAAAQAAYTSLAALLPSSQLTALNARLRVSLEQIRAEESEAAVANGIAWGKSVAEDILLWRSTDGFTDTPVFTNLPGPGVWRSTTMPPSFAAQQFADMTPWVIQSAAQFRPVDYLGLADPRYLADFNEVKAVGSALSTAVRSRDQTVFSFFWNSSTAPAIWNQVALSLLRDDDDHGGDRREGSGHSSRALVENARTLALLNLAMADAVIGCWEAKAHYNFWRPQAAIREAGTDAYPATVPDTAWTPLISTPNHPDYPSGHSCVSGAAGAILADRFGEKTRFSIETDNMLGVTRSYRSFLGALEEVKNARIYAGIHFRSACDDGQALGRNVAGYVLENALRRTGH
jgi:PAP2 superfamily protein